eukprot:m.37993 g.37993  ORF g.37993 m.37993 type:complete len:195 (+) comp9907_c0_seq1:397-981(+)
MVTGKRARQADNTRTHRHPPQLTTLTHPPICREAQEIVKTIFPAPYFEWWTLQGETYSGIEETLRYIHTYEQQHGPFVGVLGFSQGACLAATLLAQAALHMEGAALPQLQFGIVLSGFIPVDRAYAGLFSTSLPLPCFFSYGATDFKRDACVTLSHVFPAAVTVAHSADHMLPNRRNGPDAIAALDAFLKPFRK